MRCIARALPAFRGRFPPNLRATTVTLLLATRASSSKLEELASTYSQLTLRELSELQRLIFKKLGHTDEFYEKALLRGLGGGGGVMMAPAATAAAKPATESAEAETPKVEKKKVEKTTYDVKLDKYAPEIKVKLIKELRSVTCLSIADAKSAIEKCPGLVQTNMRKEDAEKLKELFEKLGATVQLL
ncbi:Ribosomal protein L7 L12 C terminal domain [Trypanosoma vivax]|uniref:60S ribosomal protein-like n=1 Tax=Trypanosoma vivax (strain Y486) TaxID=1055687 RepID=G0TYT3_TRYVY|nr:60S ribosomal protein-like [Trypanosoma vivax]KAH8614072.1 Ribosomal protein L7 L12 C terminal domain [Trypanosoma vivax]CCC49133.1 60S ribosomal protein-like [Trypanosoma vivax Y486]